MNFAKFWARGKSGDFFAWRWSFQSLAEAQSLAEQAAQQLAERFRAGDYPPKHGGYYPDRPLREQLLHDGAVAVKCLLWLRAGDVGRAIEKQALPLLPALLGQFRHEVAPRR